MNRLRAWLAEWPETVWILALGAAFYGALRWAAYYAPHAGLDGGETAVALFPGLIQVIAIWFMAWLCKRTYMRDHTGEQEQALWDAASAGNPWPLALDLAQWVLCLAPGLLVYRLLG